MITNSSTYSLLYPLYSKTRYNIRTTLRELCTINKKLLGIPQNTCKYVIYAGNRYYCAAVPPVPGASQKDCTSVMSIHPELIQKFAGNIAQLSLLTQEREQINKYFMATICKHTSAFLYTHILTGALKKAFSDEVLLDNTPLNIVEQHKQDNKQILQILNERITINLLTGT